MDSTWSGFLPPKTYFMVSKLTNAEKYLVVHRSVASRGSTPVWQPLRISCRALCNGDFDRELKIDIFQKLFSTVIVPIGSVLMTLNKMLSLSPKEKVPLMSSKGQPSTSSIRVISCTVSPVNTFVDYIRSGMQIHCCFSIDFTCSNGDPNGDPQSLHYLGGNQHNLYEQAILAVGSILQDYDNTNEWPVWGFGARLPPVGDLSYNFCVNLTDSPNCGSIPGILEAYRECLTKIQLYGPTYFAPVIKIVADMAKVSKPGENYYILVIITDGVITDMDETKKIVVESSGLPLSIVIIGVGEAEFQAMEELDGDAVRLNYKGKVASRDIVQFVAYRSARHWMTVTGESTVSEEKDRQNQNNQKNEEDDENVECPVELTPEQREVERANKLAQSQLAQEVLEEVPEQLTSYMRSKGILPCMIDRASPVPPAKAAAKATTTAKKKTKAKATSKQNDEKKDKVIENNSPVKEE